MPEPRQIVVANTTPIIALALIDQLDLLQQLYREITIPLGVSSEILAGGASGRAVVDLERLAWIRTVALQDPGRANLITDLDRGEAEVIALAHEVQASVVILDERLARRHAQHLGLPVTGTIGVLLKAKQQGLISEVGPLISGLRANGIRLSDALVLEALRLAQEEN